MLGIKGYGMLAGVALFALSVIGLLYYRGEYRTAQVKVATLNENLKQAKEAYAKKELDLSISMQTVDNYKKQKQQRAEETAAREKNFKSIIAGQERILNEQQKQLGQNQNELNILADALAQAVTPAEKLSLQNQIEEKQKQIDELKQAILSGQCLNALIPEKIRAELEAIRKGLCK